MLYVTLFVIIAKLAEGCDQIYCAKGPFISNIFRIEGKWERNRIEEPLITVPGMGGLRHLRGELVFDSSVNGFFDGIYDEVNPIFASDLSRRPLLFAVPKPADGRYFLSCYNESTHKEDLSHHSFHVSLFTVTTPANETCYKKNARYDYENLIEKLRAFQVLPPKTKHLKRRETGRETQISDTASECQGMYQKIADGRISNCEQVPKQGLCVDLVGWYCQGDNDHWLCDDWWDNCIDGSIASQCSAQLINVISFMHRCQGLRTDSKVLSLKEELYEKLTVLNNQDVSLIESVRIVTDDQNEIVAELKEQDLQLGTLYNQSQQSQLLTNRAINLMEQDGAKQWSRIEEQAYAIKSLQDAMHLNQQQTLKSIIETRQEVASRALTLKETLEELNDTHHDIHFEHRSNFEKHAENAALLKEKLHNLTLTNEAEQQDNYHKLNETRIAIEQNKEELSKSQAHAAEVNNDLKDNPTSTTSGIIGIASAGSAVFIIIIIICLICCIMRRT